ncbi:MAG: tRNA (N(6)-L-threonylcarbamoyladenosine(37)-C(2))-methylthiotransferase MtaB [Aestuariivita sp.]|nr:tRNA (N(6)-L-threonylcarbamoyladenosine(37)-C(2))-methylthiotransferase MtaB [Aestuariivita sp.]MCY4202628.1 tRNA (N(6)-L-threonylcarbamoyladenosine(37)-C(2))-methylthiotransferase MtaB [Aestuariivita sp.]
MSNIAFSTHGCRLNAYETAAMRHLAEQNNLNDLVVLNTCAVTKEATRKARKEIRKLRRDHPGATLVVTGCAAQVEPATFEGMLEVDLVVGNANKMTEEFWHRLATRKTAETDRVQVDDIMLQAEIQCPTVDTHGPRSRAYVQVQNGCDHRCTFCIIPFGRGNSRSMPSHKVVEQVRHAVNQGFLEVVLTGVDLTAWQGEPCEYAKLGDLVHLILRQVPELPRLRLSSLDPVEVDEQLMEMIATEPRLMPHFHLSVQHGDDLILKRMKRRHLRLDVLNFCEAVRQYRPDTVFGADLIVGFPTENEAQFERTVSLVNECGLTWLHVFPYSARQGTAAAKMPQVDRAELKRRANYLRAVGKQAVDRYLTKQVGTGQRVLIETPSHGRTEQFARVSFARPQITRSIVQTKIESVSDNTLVA